MLYRGLYRGVYNIGFRVQSLGSELLKGGYTRVLYRGVLLQAYYGEC